MEAIHYASFLYLSLKMENASPSVMEIQEICNKEKDTIWDETKRFVNPHEIHVDLSKKLYDLKNDLLNELHNLQED